jgi:hypothetical protein
MKGQVPFILRELRTNRAGVTEKEWLEVPLFAVKTYPLNYDSCSRFNKNEAGCKTAKGLGGFDCEFKNNFCISTGKRNTAPFRPRPLPTLDVEKTTITSYTRPVLTGPVQPPTDTRKPALKTITKREQRELQRNVKKKLSQQVLEKKKSEQNKNK